MTKRRGMRVLGLGESLGAPGSSEHITDIPTLQCFDNTVKFMVCIILA